MGLALARQLFKARLWAWWLAELTEILVASRRPGQFEGTPSRLAAGTMASASPGGVPQRQLAGHNAPVRISFQRTGSPTTRLKQLAGQGQAPLLDLGPQLLATDELAARESDVKLREVASALGTQVAQTRLGARRRARAQDGCPKRTPGT